MRKPYNIIYVFAILLSLGSIQAKAESYFGDEGVWKEERLGQPDKDGKTYLRGTESWRKHIVEMRDKYIKLAWEERLPQKEAEYRKKYGPPKDELKLIEYYKKQDLIKKNNYNSKNKGTTTVKDEPNPNTLELKPAQVKEPVITPQAPKNINNDTKPNDKEQPYRFDPKDPYKQFNVKE